MTLPIRRAVERMHAYVPGEQPAGSAVKLNTNENAHPPSPRVLDVIHAFPGESARRYPDPMATALRRALAAHHGVTPGEVLAGNGSDEILRLVAYATMDPGARMAVLSPTYSYYEVIAASFDAQVVEYPLRDDWSWPDTLWSGDEPLLYLANPNPPVGTLFPPGDIARLCRARPRTLVVVDEAYIAFAPPGSSAATLLPSHPNLIVSRTFSKSHQLAGLRVGYALARGEVMDALLKLKDSYNVNALSQAAAQAAIEDSGHFTRTRDAIVAERDRLARALTERGFDVAPSHGNFVFAQHPHAPGIFRALRDRQVYVRWFDRPRTRLGLRITVGLPEQTDALLAALEGLV